MRIENNVVDKSKMREIQSKTLREIANILIKSFGPYGSNACIKKEGALNRYTKDGHTIIGAIHYNGIIEQSIKDDIESITRHIVKTVGDGTTSAVILSSLIFDSIVDMETDITPKQIMDFLNDITADIANRIKNDSKHMELQDVYDIAMISTNGDDFISSTIAEIYEEFGPGVFIDVSPSTSQETVIKSYNGMTLNTGYCDSCYISNKTANTSEIDNPDVYFFEHPIDTKELGVYLDAIISKNFITPLNNKQPELVTPTVIFAPKISQDMSSLMDSITSYMANSPMENKLPICIVTSYHEHDQLADLAMMCGAKMIRKYIDPEVYKSDVANGLAPTPDTIENWAGSCERFVAYSDKSVFIGPSKMYNEDGSYSTVYNSLVDFIEAEIRKGTENGDSISEVGTLKRRLHSLKSNMVELFIGGITQADRDSRRDLVEDAVLNVRSAATNGVGFGGNVSAYIALSDLVAEAGVLHTDDEGNNTIELQGVYGKILYAVFVAYCRLISILFGGFGVDTTDIYNNAVKEGLVYNIREGQWSTNVKTSIMSDITILDTVTKIVGIMATANQFILPSAMHNVYIDTEENNKK